MNALVRKEIRSLLPAWIAAMLLVMVPETVVWSVTRHTATPPDSRLFVLFGLGILLLALASFGQEFGAGTFSNLLVQPVPRRRIWRIKVTVLVVALLSVTLIFLAGFSHLPMRGVGPEDDEFLSYSGMICGLMVTCVLAGGLWTTLLLRQLAAAFCLTLAAPGLICLVCVWIGSLRLAWSDREKAALVAGALAIYSGLGFFWARRLFLRAQDAPWGGGTLAVPAWFNLPTLARRHGAMPKRKPLRALMWKEIQFHHVSLLLAAVAFVLFVTAGVFRQMLRGAAEPGWIASIAIGLGFMLWFTLPFLLGSLGVAEERRLGTLESQLCLPVTKRVQFAVKFGMVIFLSVLLCAVIPFLIDSISVRLGVPGGALSGQTFTTLSAFAAGIAALSFYASTLTRNTLQAMGAAVVANVLAGAVLLYMLHPTVFFIGVRLGSGPLFGCIGGPLMVVALFWLAMGNYKRALVDSKLWLRNSVVLLAVLFFGLMATSLVYNRSWELFMHLQPPHGPAKLSGAVKPKICAMGEKFFVLLPDGRLWMSHHSERRFLFDYLELSRIKKAYAHVPLDGDFVGASDWVAIGNRYAYPVYGLKSDGSLWQFSWPNRTNHQGPLALERIGTDSDWKTFADGNGFFLAVKTDGTLWGSGWNGEGVLGPGPKQFTNGPVRIGADSDWSEVYADNNLAIGVKRDGSVWKWGSLSIGPTGRWLGSGNQSHPDPVRWNLNGTDWAERTGSAQLDVILRRDGTAWATGWLPQKVNILGETWGRESVVTNLVRIGKDTLWTDLAISGDLLTAIKKNGAYVENMLDVPGVLGGTVLREPSRYSDWLTAAPISSDMPMALAADGTLSCWLRLPEETASGRQLLGPTRKPFWSLNILTGTKE